MPHTPASASKQTSKLTPLSHWQAEADGTDGRIKDIFHVTSVRTARLLLCGLGAGLQRSALQLKML